MNLGGLFRAVNFALSLLPPSLDWVGFQAAFIVCVSCHFGLDGWMEMEAIKMLVRISLKTRRPKFL